MHKVYNPNRWRACLHCGKRPEVRYCVGESGYYFVAQCCRICLASHELGNLRDRWNGGA